MPKHRVRKNFFIDGQLVYKRYRITPYNSF
jgi:hypothetical protein